MELLHLFVGDIREPLFYRELFDEEAQRGAAERSWPEKQFSSAYFKEEVSTIRVSQAQGIVGNGIGFPTHIDNAFYRTALVINTCVYDDFEKEIPGSGVKLRPGIFGENMVVSDPLLHPRVVCVGDIYQIGSAKFVVTGPRMPCPKVDAYVGVKGLTALGKRFGWTGYFLRVIEDGECSVGDSFVLQSRPFPNLSITTIQMSLWGEDEEKNESEEFLRALSEVECLMPRHYRDTALQRLSKLK